MEHTAPTYGSLTEKDKQILSLIAQGHPRESIPKMLRISDQTITAARQAAMDAACSPNFQTALLRLVVDGVVDTRVDPVIAAPEPRPDDSEIVRLLITKMNSCLNWREMTELRHFLERAERWGW